MENPVEILYCWQSLLVAATAAALTQLIKTIIDIVWGQRAIKKAAASVPPPPMGDGPYRTSMTPKQTGHDIRKNSVIVNRLILPATPVLLGALFAIIVPARPDALVAYVAANEIGWMAYLIYAAWGAACGQFADYIWSKVKAVLQTMTDRAVAQRAPATTPSTPPGSEGNEG